MNERRVSRTQQGFTIVELIVIVVVIAIIAAITIVSYAAVTDNARQQTASTDAQTIAAQLSKYKSEKGAYPATLNSLGDTPATQSTYQYAYDAAAGTYCLTASVKGASAYVVSGNSEPKEGGCPGHGVNGEEPVRNLAKNPVLATSTAGWTGYNAAGGHSYGVGPQQLDGDRTWRVTAGANGISGGASIGYEYQGTGIAVSPGDTVVPSLYVRAAKAGTYRICGQFFNGTSQTASYSAATTAIAANTWVRLVGTEYTVTAPTDRMNIRACYVSGTTWASGDWFELTRISTAPGEYADGDSPNWIWTGTANASVSTGPEL